METWRDLVLAPGGARGEVSPPTLAKVLNTLLAIIVLVAAVWISLVSLHYNWGWASVWDYRRMLLEGWFVTMGIAGAALVLSLAGGFLLALAQRSSVLPLRYFAKVLVELVRCTPLLVLILLLWYGVGGVLGISNSYRFLVGILILALFESAYISEIMRAGIEGVGKTQIESARAIGFTDQANHNYDTSDFFTALRTGNLPSVSFIKAPAYENAHPGNSDPTSEQNWIVSTVNQIMLSPYWADTAIIITYDDSDGWYDHVNGPIVSPSNVSVDGLAGPGNCGKPLAGANPARCGHGPRLPLLVLSPWAQPNHVDHTLTDQASVINFVEANWRLGSIDGPNAAPNGQGSFDRYAGTLMHMFSFEAPPYREAVLLNCDGSYVERRQQAPTSCP